MCRISGIINPNLPTSSLHKMVQEMCTLMKHGGPDDEGLYVEEESHVVLGHRRLSLIDLSHNGHQPMKYDRDNYVISFNGEIYNYQEIKSELRDAGCDFKTESDTEVILAAFAKWGTDSFEKLNGMFAFALWDKKDHKLFLVRDPSGIKPLYYSTKEGLVFSSEIRALKSLPWLQNENKNWPVFFLAYGHLPEPVTVLEDVAPLPKGSWLEYDVRLKNIYIQQFKKYRYSNLITSREKALASIKTTLRQSVDRHLISDAPIGVFLSGGVDSGIVSVLASKNQKSHLNTLSLYFNEQDFSEKKYQDVLLQNMQCERHQHLLKEEEFHSYLPSILDAMDQPSCDGINTWFISKYARENGLKAVLSGVGGDELYGGYPSFVRMKKVSMLQRLPHAILKSGKYANNKALKRLCYLGISGAAGKYLFLRGQLIPSEIAGHLNMEEREVWNILSEQPLLEDIDDLSAFDQASWIELNMFMQNQLLRDGDVMGMAHGIEIRVPFLDQKFADLSCSVRDSTKSEGRLPKQLLIDAFKDVLPQPIWDRPKMGFGFPFKKWLAKDEYVKDMMGMGDKKYTQFISGNMHWSQFLSLLLLQKRGVISHGIAAKQQINGNRISGSRAQKNRSRRKVMLLTLRTFSMTGGIEKVSRVAGKALFDLSRENDFYFTAFSMYDDSEDVDEKYFPDKNFKGFGIRRIQFTEEAVRRGMNQNVVVLSHVNLLPVGYMIKKMSPGTRLILIAHGIEIWKSFYGMKRRMLMKCDQVLSVSRFTKDKIVELNHYPADKIQVLNNCLDPFLEKPVGKDKDKNLLEKYNFQKGDTILMTLTRLASREKYKGYDQVIKGLAELRKTNPQLKYLIIGKYDAEEKKRLDALLKKWNLTGNVSFTGFIPDEELAEHFNLGDIYIMPSEKEGFGIVFIEAMYYNKPVIAGNKDGSVDALLDGELGLLVNPESQEEVSAAIMKMIENRNQYLPDRDLLMKNFSYPVYKENWKKILQEL